MNSEAEIAQSAWVAFYTGTAQPLLIAVIAASIALLGQARLSKTRGQRDLSLSDADALIKQVDVIREHAVRYFSDPSLADDPLKRTVLEVRINGMLHGVVERISVLNLGNSLEKKPLDEAFRAFRTGCTGGDFGSVVDYSDVAKLRERLSMIEAEGQSFCAKLLVHRQLS